ncbi:hypothetical protein JJB67_16165 [Clostridium perfringens]|uniref:Uncharacterized protein n=1 Tax=Clostridium perfringens TaxID=1502 RepID=G5DSC0_CLOPF|nr:hypothetical protein [Clostridium perfringens]AEP94961.1 hypothetical protein pBeta2_00071 [Clostridium perfringens]MBO3304555.1 hypothetical protein [Clostridium perfringens]MBO3307867.1 hypothetical protein [Clostridium perfringens]MBO3311198.1 hypothetical protein [Clostridium perfringens]MBO3317473.1 hypothetical protein [Clostridium perfringens]
MELTKYNSPALFHEEYNSPLIDYRNLSISEEEAWFLVFIAVLLALGATVVLGAAIWCVVKGHGSFTGGVKWDSGIQIHIECK